MVENQVQVPTVSSGQITSSASIPRLNGKNFQSWKELVELVLELRDLKVAIEVENCGDSKKNLQAKLIILETLDESHRAQVRGCESAKNIVDRLKLIYADTSAANVYRLLLQYYRFEKRPEDSMSEHIGRMDEMRNQLADLGQKQSEEVYQVTLIGSLPKEYSSIMEVWELTHESMRTTANLVSRLLKREEDVKKSACTGQAFVARETRPRMSLDELKKVTKCHKCGQKGHWARECRSDTRKNEPERAMIVSRQKPEEDAFSFQVSDESHNSYKNTWLADSGASSHMCNNKSWFTTLELYDQPSHCKVGDGVRIKVLGIGTIRVKSRIDGKWLGAVIRNILYVPELATNLVSIGSAADNGVNTLFEKQGCTMINAKTRTAVAVGIRLPHTNRLYVMDMVANQQMEDAAFNISRGQSLESYHRILGHASAKRIRDLLEGLGIQEVKEKSIDCPDCPGGRGQRVPHPIVGHRVEAPGVLHIDLSGINNKASIQGFNYYMIAKDCFTEFVFGYYCKSKSEVPQLVARLLIDFERLSGFIVREVCTDCGSEFVNETTKILFLKEKIRHCTSAPYCPQQNGRAEREIRTITEVARTLLNASKLPRELWREAVACAIYLKNRLPTSRSSKSPYERFLNRKPTYEHLVEFGSTVHVIVNDRYLTKWDARTEQGFVVGYTQRRNTYRIYIPSRGRVVESCDVIFARHQATDNIREVKQGEDLVKIHIEMLENAEQKVNSETNTDSSGRSTIVYVNDERSQPQAEQNTLDCFETAEQMGSSTPITKRGKSLCTGAQLDEFFSQYTKNQEDPENDETEKKPPQIYENMTNDTTKTMSKLECRACRAERPDVPPPPPPQEEGENKTIPSCPTYEELNNRDDECGMICAVDSEVPRNYDEAMSPMFVEKWKNPIEAELTALEDNETWAIVDIPKGHRLLSTKWVLGVKRDANGVVILEKARLVVRGFEQQLGVNFFQTFAPVVRLDSYRLLLALSAAKRLHILQFDISTAFLNGKIDEEVYIAPPQGLRVAEGKCLKLNKALYGLRQAPRAWNSTFDTSLRQLGFRPTLSDACVYVHTRDQIYVLIYVDDGLIFGPSKAACANVLEGIRAEFKLKELNGELFLGIQMKMNNGVVLTQQRYIQDVLMRFQMEDARGVTTPIVNTKDLETSDGEPADEPYRQLLGCLQYLACCTRPDISFATNFLARFSNSPQKKHWTAALRVLRYLKQTSDYGLAYHDSDSAIRVTAYSDADHGGDQTERRSTSGVLVLINGSPIVFASRRQGPIAQSSTEAEYVAACEVAKEIKWVTQMLSELKVTFVEPQLYIDNKSTIYQIENADTKRRSKHIELKYHFVRQQFREKLFKITYVESENNVADILTKSISGPQLDNFLVKIKMRNKVSGGSPVGGLVHLALFVLMVSDPVLSARFQRSEPLVFMDSPFQPEMGMRSLEFDLALVSPCKLTENKEDRSMYGLKAKMYTNLVTQCNEAYEQLIRELQLLRGCLPSNRDKRAVPLILGAIAVGAAAGGKSLYRHYYEHSDYNRIGRLETRATSSEEKIAELQTLIKEVEGELVLAKDIRRGTIEGLERVSNRSWENQLAIEQLGELSPAISWASTQTAAKLERYREGITLLAASCSERRLSVAGLNKIVKLQELNRVKEHDTHLQHLTFIDEKTISGTVYIDENQSDSKVYEILAIKHWANISTDPVFTDYHGPKYVIVNNKIDCFRGIENPSHRVILESCTEPGYHDQCLMNWQALKVSDEEIKRLSEPIVYKIGDVNKIYCTYHNITVYGRENRCPPWPFELHRTVPFNFTNGKYSVEKQYVNKRDYDMKIMPITLNETDADYDRDMQMFKALKGKQDSSIPAGQLSWTKGTLSIPLDYSQGLSLGTLGIIASIITIWSCIRRASGIGSSATQEDIHREEHKEQIIINPDVNKVMEDHTKRMDQILELLVTRIDRQKPPIQSVPNSYQHRPLPDLPDNRAKAQPKLSKA